MTPWAEAGVISRYVDSLDDRLRGLAAVKADLLTETRDSLDDATEVHRDRGCPRRTPNAARSRSSARSPVVVPEYQAELAVAHGTRPRCARWRCCPADAHAWEYGRCY